MKPRAHPPQLSGARFHCFDFQHWSRSMLVARIVRIAMHNAWMWNSRINSHYQSSLARHAADKRPMLSCRSWYKFASKYFVNTLVRNEWDRPMTRTIAANHTANPTHASTSLRAERHLAAQKQLMSVAFAFRIGIWQDILSCVYLLK